MSQTLYFYIYTTDDGLTLPAEAVSFLDSPYFNDWLVDGTDYKAMITRDATRADYFVFPYSLDELARKVGSQRVKHLVRVLPFFAAHSSRHIFMKGDTGGKTTFRLNTDACIINLNPSAITSESGDISIHHIIGNDIVSQYAEDFTRIQYHINFMGSLLTHPVRLHMGQSLQQASDLAIFFKPQTTSYWFLSPEERCLLRSEYISSILDSWLILCPRGTGSSSVRMYEAMALGRIPVVISDEYIFPLKNEINYTDFCLIMPEKEVENLPQLAAIWLKKNRSQLSKKCSMARSVWEQYFSNFSYVRSKLLENMGRASLSKLIK